jgi:hypothetical protein
MLWETGDEIFPSLGAEFIQDLGSRFELEAYSFGYLRVEKQSAWAVGLRGSRRLAFSDHVSISPFFGPAYGRVRALDESIETQNRNFVGFYFDTGLVYTGLIPTRDEDQVGVGFVYAQLTNGARRTLELEGSRGVGAEMVLEFTYKAFLTPWLYIQPDAQLIINPGATQDLRNAFVLGGRVSINF